MTLISRSWRLSPEERQREDREFVENGMAMLAHLEAAERSRIAVLPCSMPTVEEWGRRLTNSWAPGRSQ